MGEENGRRLGWQLGLKLWLGWCWCRVRAGTGDMADFGIGIRELGFELGWGLWLGLGLELGLGF